MSATMPSKDEFVGTKRFAIRRRLGAGGMGVVYEAYDRDRDAVVALKTLRHLDEYSLYRFKNEFRSLADIRHPNLVALGELFFENGTWFFTMERVEGASFISYVKPSTPSAADPPDRLPSTADTLTDKGLAKLIDSRRRVKRYDENKLRASLQQLARGICALHEVGKVHRDVKPSNILVTLEGRVVLLDFGLVTSIVDGSQNSDVNIVGTATYMAPEQGAGRPVGPEADWYSVGAVLYEALTGAHPFEGSSYDIVMAKQRIDPPSPRSLAPHVPADLDQLCTELLRRDPKARPTGHVLLTRLGGEPAPPPLTPSSSSHRLPFVGRERELSILRSALADAACGKTVTLFLHGESGVGKSALVCRFATSLAHEADVLVLSGRCYERESIPFRAFDGIVDALAGHLSNLDPVDAALLLPEDAALLARTFPTLRRAQVMARCAEPRRDIPNPQEIRRRVFAALRRLFARLADRHRMMLFIDDFHWADADSLGLLVDILQPPESPPLLLVATLRSSADGRAESEPLLSKFAASLGSVRHLQVEPLSSDEARALAAMLVGKNRPSIDPEALAQEAQGHPLFIHELARHVLTSGARAPATLRLEEALWSRIARLDAPARTLLEVIVLAGIPVAPKVALLASGVAFPSGLQWLSTLRTENLIAATGTLAADTLEPYHDRVRSTVLARLAEEDRKAHHARLADALESTGMALRDPQVLVRHLEAAGENERAARYAARAAFIAFEGLAFEQAAALYGTALRLGSYAAAERCAILTSMGDALAYAGRGFQAAEAYLAAVRDAEGATRLECQRRAAEQLLLSGHIDEGLAAIANVLAEVGEHLPTTPRRALLSLLWRRIKIRCAGLETKQRHETEISARDLVKLDVYKAVALGLGMVDTIRGADFQSRCLLLALRTGERRRLGRSIAQEAMLVASQGGCGLARARKLGEQARAIAEASGEPYLLAWSTAASGLIDYFAGAFPAAARELSDAETLFRDETTGTAWELSNVRLFRLFALRHTGSWKNLAHSFDQYVRDAARRGDRYAETTMSRALNVVWLARGEPEYAETELNSKGWTPPRVSYHIQHWYDLRARLELALYRGGVREVAEGSLGAFDALRRSLLPRTQILRAEAAWLRGRVALAQADDAERGESLAEAARMARVVEREHAPYATVWANLLDAGIALGCRDRRRARSHLDAAIEAAEHASMLMCAAAARRRAGEITVGDEGKDLVAQAERDMTAMGVDDPKRMARVLVP